MGHLAGLKINLKNNLWSLSNFWSFLKDCSKRREEKMKEKNKEEKLFLKWHTYSIILSPGQRNPPRSQCNFQPRGQFCQIFTSCFLELGGESIKSFATQMRLLDLKKKKKEKRQEREVIYWSLSLALLFYFIFAFLIPRPTTACLIASWFVFVSHECEHPSSQQQWQIAVPSMSASTRK